MHFHQSFLSDVISKSGISKRFLGVPEPFLLWLGRRARQVAFHGAFVSVGSVAWAQCEVIDDTDLYQARKQQAILLMQYGDVVVRAAGGRIRCTENQAKARQVCAVTGPGEMLVEAGASQLIVRLTGAGDYSVHLTQDGQATCQP